MRYVWQGVVIAILWQICNVKIAANLFYVCQGTYCMVQVIGWQLELLDKSGKTLNVQDVKILYPIDELIKCLSYKKAFRSVARYYAHLNI